jgi:hypothetical protein
MGNVAMSNQGRARAECFERERINKAWSAGFLHAKRGGKLRDNPHNGISAPAQWHAWTGGYRDAKKWERQA